MLNSCTVKDPSQAAFVNLVNKGIDQDKKIVVAGCVPQGDKNVKELQDISVVGVSQIDRIVEVVEETLKGNVVQLTRKKALPQLDLPKIRRNPLIEIIPLSTGCLGSCTYCKTKAARGKLGSYEPASIIDRAVKVATKEGVTEIWLSSEDTGAYGLDLGSNLPRLMNSILDAIPKVWYVKKSTRYANSALPYVACYAPGRDDQPPLHEEPSRRHCRSS